LKLNIEQEIELARRDGVHAPENLPFLLTPEQPHSQGILLVHGFGSTPREMSGLAEHLFKRGVSVLAVRLPGHGTSPEDLATRRAEEWLAAVKRGYQILQQRGLSVSTAGLSTGSLLLLQLSLDAPVERQVLLAPFLRLKHPLAPFAKLLSLFLSYHERQIPLDDQSYYYQRRPLKGVAQLNRIRRRVKRILPQITTPTLVLTSSGDRTVAPGTAKKLFEKLGSNDKQYHCYGDEVPHVLTTNENPCQKDVFERTLNFLLLASGNS